MGQEIISATNDNMELFSCSLTLLIFLPPANEVCEGYVFTGVCLSTGGRAWFYSGGGCAWFYLGGGVCGFIQGGHAWFYLGGVHGFIWGGMHGFIWEACMVLFGKGMHGFFSFFQIQ